MQNHLNKLKEDNDDLRTEIRQRIGEDLNELEIVELRGLEQNLYISLKIVREGGESIYGGAFVDEFHSRLSFNQKGLVACVNDGLPHSNGSRFFISLDRCEWLDRKKTIFGKITGDSIFNLEKLGECETDEDGRPLNPLPKIISVEVLQNPFEDIIPRIEPKTF